MMKTLAFALFALLGLTVIVSAQRQTMGYLYRGEDFEVLRSIRLNDPQTWPAPNYDFYQGKAPRHTIPNQQQQQGVASGANVPPKEEPLPDDPVARAMELTKNIEPRICTDKEELALIDDATCKTNSDCDLICRDYAGKQTERVAAYYCDPRGNTCGCCSTGSVGGGSGSNSGSSSFGPSSFGDGSNTGGSGSFTEPSFGSSGFGDSSFGSNTNTQPGSSNMMNSAPSLGTPPSFGNPPQGFGNTNTGSQNFGNTNTGSQDFSGNMNTYPAASNQPDGGYYPSNYGGDQAQGGNMAAYRK